jgi:hypothetical protein
MNYVPGNQQTLAMTGGAALFGGSVTQSIIIAAFIMMAGLALMGFATLFGRVAVEPVRTTGNKRRFVARPRPHLASAGVAVATRSSSGTSPRLLCITHSNRGIFYVMMTL